MKEIPENEKKNFDVLAKSFCFFADQLSSEISQIFVRKNRD